jgi:hypothetical protein
MQARAVTPATSNTRIESSNRNANTVGTPIKAGTHGKVPGSEASNRMQEGDTIYIRDDSSRDVISSRTARISRKVSNSRVTSNIEKGHRIPDGRCQRCQKQFVSHNPTAHEFSRKFAKRRRESLVL